MIKNRLAKILFFLLGYGILGALLIYYFYLDKLQRTQVYLKQQILTLHSEFQATKNTYTKLSQIVYDELYNDTTFLQALLTHNIPQIQKILKHHYAILQRYSINYLSLYSPQGETLVTFHTINKKTPQKSTFFSVTKESGLILKFKRPFLYQNSLLATFETAISYNTLKLELQKLFPSYYEYIVSEKTLKTNLRHLKNHLFIQSDLHPKFYYEKDLRQQRSNPKKLLIHAINSAIKKQIAQQLLRGVSFATFANVEGTYYVITFLAIKTKEALAYLISYRPDANIAIFDTIFWQNVIVSLVALGVILVFFYYFLETKEQLEQMAVTDKLTGLYNRHKFYQIIDQELQRAQRHQRPLSIILLDIDHFKKINDTYGHDIGDRVLKSVATLIKKNIRKYDKAFRWGGEEFIIVAPETSPQDAVKLAEKLRTIIASHHFDIVDKVTISLGVAGTNNAQEIHNIDGLIKPADNALYISKKEGRNRTTLSL